MEGEHEMKQTKEEKAIYQAAWRKKNPAYQVEHRAWLRVEHEKIRAEYLSKKKRGGCK